MGVLVTKAWYRHASRSSNNDNWAPGRGRFAAHDHPHPCGPLRQEIGIEQAGDLDDVATFAEPHRPRRALDARPSSGRY